MVVRQHGVREKRTDRFQPLRIATSILDYVFRRLAVDYLTPEDRHALGIRTSGERQTEIESALETDAGSEGGNGHAKGNGGSTEGVIVLGPVADVHSGSLPFCGTCGVQMRPAGSCFACPTCGSTSGCS